jgi:glycosyltransferase involved in cell wall biosynthesis
VAIHEPRAQPHPFVEALAADGINTYVIEVKGRAYLRERAAVRALCVNLKPSIVHTHGYRPDLIAAPAARREGNSTVTTVHGFTSYGVRGRLYELLQRRAFRHFDAVVAVSQPIANKLVTGGIDPKRTYVIPNAIDDLVAPLPREEARQILGLGMKDFVIGWVGRLSPEKGPDVFVAALAELSHDDVRACVVGDGPERTALEVQARSLGVAAAITWAGSVPNAGRLFSAFDVLVLSSRTEGTPVVLIEAVAAGIPIVATRVGGVPDLLRASEAYLVDPLAPREIASAVRLVQNAPDDARRRTVSAAGRVVSAKAHARWINEYDRVYRTALEN